MRKENKTNKEVLLNPSTEITTIDNSHADPTEELSKKAIALKEAGVTRKEMYTCLAEGLKATKKSMDADGEGNPVLKEEPDLLIRHKYLDTAARIYGDLKDSTVAVAVGVNLSPEEKNLIDAYRKDVGVKR